MEPTQYLTTGKPSSARRDKGVFCAPRTLISSNHTNTLQPPTLFAPPIVRFLSFFLHSKQIPPLFLYSVLAITHHASFPCVPFDLQSCLFFFSWRRRQEHRITLCALHSSRLICMWVLAPETSKNMAEKLKAPHPHTARRVANISRVARPGNLS